QLWTLCSKHPRNDRSAASCRYENVLCQFPHDLFPRETPDESAAVGMKQVQARKRFEGGLGIPRRKDRHVLDLVSSSGRRCVFADGPASDTANIYRAPLVRGRLLSYRT